MCGTSSLSSPTSSANTAPLPDGASCWLCLEEGPDEEGAPLVRNCSCRGCSGFAHLPCIIKYAESMARQMLERRVMNAILGEAAVMKSALSFANIFLKCPNCKQDYQDDIQAGMAKAFAAFKKSFAPKNNHAETELLQRLQSLDEENEAGRVEGEEIVAKLLALIEETKQNGDSNYAFEARAYVYVGEFYERISSDDSLKRAKDFYEKARDICNVQEFDLDRREVDIKIGWVESKLSGKNGHPDEAAELKLCQEQYECCIERGNDVHIINAGVNLANALYFADRTIKAERLLEKMVANSHRIHGPDHKSTVKAVSILKKMKERWVILESKQDLFEVLRYENGGEKCVVQGPIKENRVVDEEQTYEVESIDVRPYIGTPVVLHGLKKAANLNGMIGEATKHCQSSDRYVVHLEDEGLKPVKVKHGNLRVIFDLPDPKNLD